MSCFIPLSCFNRRTGTDGIIKFINWHRSDLWTCSINETDGCDNADSYVVTRCYHSFCEKCYKRIKSDVCPMCEAVIDRNPDTPEDIR